MTQSEFLDQLKALVTIPTLSGDVEKNAQALDSIQELLPAQAVVKRYQNKDAEILIASNQATMTPKYGYLVHVDVVSAKPNLFTMEQEGDVVRGRGVSDMKFSIPLGIALLTELIEKESPDSFAVVITTDEEVGGFGGAAYLAENLKWRPEILIVPDGGDNFVFVNKAKGVCQLSVVSTGSPAHASRPWDGVNALYPLIRLTAELLKRYEKPSSAKAWVTTLNIGQFQGGISTNQVCDRAEVKLDFRFPETDSRERIIQEVTAIANQCGGQLEINPLSSGQPTFTDANIPIVKKFIASVAAETRSSTTVQETYGASDARHFAPYGIPVLMMKPNGGDIHCDTEWLSISATMEYYQGLRRFLELK